MQAIQCSESNPPLPYRKLNSAEYTFGGDHKKAWVQHRVWYCDSGVETHLLVKDFDTELYTMFFMAPRLGIHKFLPAGLHPERKKLRKVLIEHLKRKQEKESE